MTSWRHLIGYIYDPGYRDESIRVGHARSACLVFTCTKLLHVIKLLKKPAFTCVDPDSYVLHYYVASSN